MRLTIGALVFAALAAGCTGRDVRGPFRNQYIDAETGKPIEGVVFLAVWYSTNVNLVDGGGESFYDAREVTSGPDGRVEVPALRGPVWRPGLAVRFHEFASGGWVGEQVRTTPNAGREYVDPTVTTMRRLRTRAERCEATRRPSLIPTVIGAAPADKLKTYMTALDRERDELQCASLVGE